MMSNPSDTIEKNYQHYLARLSEIDFAEIGKKPGIEYDAGVITLPFFNTRFFISNGGIVDASGNRPEYSVMVILSKYLLSYPDVLHHETDWTAFKDFKKIAQFTNVNYFASDTVRAIENHFSNRLKDLETACAELNGVHQEMETAYDVSVRFDALPHIALLLLFNDRDDEFPATCTVLFQKRAEYYLDPESLAMTSAYLARRLRQQAC